MATTVRPWIRLRDCRRGGLLPAIETIWAAADRMPCEALVVPLIDAANVVGSSPTGWWRDRAKAAAEFVKQVRVTTAAGSRLIPPVVVVLEGVARQGVDEDVAYGVEVVHAPGRGDDTLVALASTATEPVLLVSADKALGERCRAIGSEVVGPGWLLSRLLS